MEEISPSSKIVLHATGNRHNKINMFTGILLIGVFTPMAIFSFHSIEIAGLFIFFGICSFILFLFPKKLSDLIIENGFLECDQGDMFAFYVSKMKIQDINKIFISSSLAAGKGNLGLDPSMMLIDSKKQMFRFDISNLEKEDLILLGQALLAAPVIQNTKEVQGLLHGDLSLSFLPFSV